MLKTVTVVNQLGESLTMELAHPEKSGFNIYNIEGIGAGSADINVTELTTVDGSKYNSARRQQRNIVLYMKYMWDPLIEDSRHRSYRMFRVKSKVKLIFETDYRVSQIEGYVESNEPVFFEQEEYTAVSIICPDPYFSNIDGQDQVTVFSGVEAWFEFPFENEDLYEPTIIFGNIKNFTEETIYYEGDSEVGVRIYISTYGTVGNITIYNTETQEKMKIDLKKIQSITGAPFAPGDEIIISTIKRYKSIRLQRQGVYYNILNALDRDADWFQLQPGDNVFAFVVDEGENTSLQIRMENQVLYEGV